MARAACRICPGNVAGATGSVLARFENVASVERAPLIGSKMYRAVVVESSASSLLPCVKNAAASAGSPVENVCRVPAFRSSTVIMLVLVDDVVLLLDDEAFA